MTEDVNCSTIPRVRRLLLTVMALCVGLALWSVLFGGVQLRFGATTVRSHDPVRPLILAVVLFFVYGIAFRPAFSKEAVRIEHIFLRVAGWTVLIGALAVSALSFRWSTYSAAGSDSSGYVSQAYGWLYGPLPRPLPVPAKLPWPSATASLAPLGYMAAPGNQGIVPTYAPGLPLMMAGLLRVTGPRGPYFVVPLFAGLIVWATFALGRRIGGVAVGALAALFVAVSPIVLFQALSPMTDVPIGALWTTAAVAALSDSRRSPLLAGLVGAIAVAGSSQPAARARRLRRSFSAHGLDVARRADPRGHVCRARRPGGAGHRSAQLTLVREPVPFRIRLGRSALFCCQHLAEPAALSCLARPIAFTAVVVVSASAGDVEAARCELDGRTDSPTC